MEVAVAIPLGWFLTSIGGLCTIIGTLGVTIFNIQNKRLEDERERSREAMEALNSNTQALEQMTELVNRFIDTQVRRV